MKSITRFLLMFSLICLATSMVNAQKTATLTDDINSKGASYDSGTSPNLKIRGDNLEKEIFLKFTMPSGINYIHSIELELRSGSASVTDIDVYKSNVLASSWSESNISSGSGGNEPTPDQLVSTSAEVPMSGGGQQAVWQLDKSYFSSGEIVSLVVIRDMANQNETSFIAKTSNNQPILRCYTCDDNVQNGDETGVDCGGSCPNSCGGGNNSPTADFTSSANGLTVTFTDSSSDPDNDNLTYSWNFGDGSSSTQQNPTHTYASANTYSVTLTVDDGNGGTDSETKSVTVTSGGGGNNPPTADFTSSANGLTATFTDSSSDPDNDNLTYSWNFGDGSSSTQQNPTHNYASANTYSVTLTVDDGNGGTDSETKSVTVSSGGSGGTGAWSQSPSNADNIFYNTGNVGIGTNNPIEMLHVAGEIYAVKVRVSTDAGADFVFEEGYQLMTLEELEAFVKKNKHLPEIPSEQEMIDHDLQLGDFSIKLLQKVEELTLYMIDLKKENTKLSAQIEELKAENKEMKKNIKALSNQ